MISERERRRIILRVGWVNAFVNGSMGLVKLVVGWLTQSQALVADGVHSISDLFSDVLVLLAGHHGAKEADADHPYGHRRFETLGVVILAGLLILTAAGLIGDAFERLISDEPIPVPGLWALAAAAGSIVGNEFLFFYGRHWGRKARSQILVANAWHSRSDSISSVIVLFSLLGALLGMTYLDAVATIIIGALVFNMGWKMGRDSFLELVDTSVGQERLACIRRQIGAVEGVRSWHELRTRRMGGSALVDVHIQVNPLISVSEGNQIAETVIERVKEGCHDVLDVTVHVDAEQAEAEARGRGLPDRERFLHELYGVAGDLDYIGRIERVRLHYLKGQLHAELIMPSSLASSPQAMQAISRQLQAACKRLPYVGDVQVLFSTHHHGA